MIHGAHVIIFSTDAEADRAFFRDVLAYPSVDAGHGWLIFALPPGELGVHPTGLESDENRHQLYLMCDDIETTVTGVHPAGKGSGLGPADRPAHSRRRRALSLPAQAPVAPDNLAGTRDFSRVCAGRNERG